MKKFFYLLMLPLLFVACEPGNTPEPPVPVSLTLTSDASMMFEAEGGQGVITYTLTAAEESALPGVTCEAEWITNIEVGQTITFDVAVNEGDDRQTKIVVAYSTESFEVTVRQSKGEESVPTEELVANNFLGSYYSPEALGTKTHLYSLLLSNADLSVETVTPKAFYFYFDLYSDEVNEDFVVPEGTYHFDRLSTKQAGTIDSEGSLGFTVNSSGTDFETTYIYHDATVVVTKDKLVAEVVLADGSKVVITYEGSLLTEPGEFESESTLTDDLSINLENAMISAYNYEDYYYTDEADNWYVQVASTDNNSVIKCFYLDFLADINYGSWDVSYHALEGYDFSDPEAYVDSFIPGYVDSEGYIAGCWYAEMNGDGYIAGDVAPLYHGNIDVEFGSNNSVLITLNCRDDAGNDITGTISGFIYE